MKSKRTKRTQIIQVSLFIASELHFRSSFLLHLDVFIILSVLWGWGIDKKTPDLYDWIGAVICLVGVSVMLWGPRN